MLRGGEWQGRRLLDSQWVARALRYAGLPKPPRHAGNPAPASGLCWYTNEDGVWPYLPPDAFAGAGAGHQVLLAVPSLDLLVVRNGEALAPPSAATFWGAAGRHLLQPLAGCLR
jgi:CubicO group peptidase (beta-lactamase class C family)